MKTITLTCETITPMCLAGADGSTPELRAPSIKGALRFWWRAMNGHLSLDELKKREAAIFGGTDKGQGRSKVIIQVPQKELSAVEAKPVPHKSFRLFAFQTQQNFTVKLSLTQDEIIFEGNIIFDLEKLQALFILVATLGGFGKRSRRGMGSVRINQIDDTVFECVTINDIYRQINKVNKGKFRMTGDSILSNFGRDEKYPYIKQIQLGTKINHNYLYKISDTTHEFKQQDPKCYKSSLGHADGGRFASPIYVSLIQVGSQLMPIITTLNAVADRGRTDTDFQEQFKNAILL